MLDLTPEQALKAAIALRLHAPASSYAACLAAADYLEALAKQSGAWTVHGGDLYAADPGTPVQFFPRVALAFALFAPAAWHRPGQSVRTGFGNRATAKAQRHRLAARLRRKGLHTLAEAVEDIGLASIAGRILATYTPRGLPVRIAQRN